MEVDLDAIAANVAAIAAHAKADVIAVVKADAYGHGAEAVSEAAVSAGAALLAVATVEEGMALRAAGIDAPVLVLLGAATRAEADAAIAAGLTSVVWDPERAELLAAAARAARTRASVHFKVDTGLTRLGSLLDAAAANYRETARLDGLQIDGAMTHYATADDPDPAFAEEQSRRFAHFVDALPSRPRWVHASASAGAAVLGAGQGCNAVRPGIALYGIAPAAHLAGRIRLRPALTWRSAVLRVADVPAGTGVSYGHEYRLERAGRIATIPVGYGDGLPRVFGRSGRVLVGGAALPLAGRVCMDLVMVDVTAQPGVREGDEVVLIGEQGDAASSADDVAAACGTISYEVLTNIRSRVPRRYVARGRVVATKTLVGGHARC
ncbi:MAG: alanine racemase [Candidatus Limnocylindria bacterium]